MLVYGYKTKKIHTGNQYRHAKNFCFIPLSPHLFILLMVAVCVRMRSIHLPTKAALCNYKGSAFPRYQPILPSLQRVCMAGAYSSTATFTPWKSGCSSAFTFPEPKEEAWGKRTQLLFNLENGI